MQEIRKLKEESLRGEHVDWEELKRSWVFKVVVHKRVRKELKKSSEGSFKKFAEAVDVLKTNPVP